MAQSREAAIRKVRACLALAAPASNAPEPERATARAMATKLMLEHNLRAEDVRQPAEAPAPRRAPPPPDPGDITIVVNLGGFSFGGGGFRFRFDDSTATTGGW